ncbi:MAG: radical SAM protein [Myxococcales bacterium]|nr:radical SAM protein [Myxococcales bacterium]
MGVFSKTDTHQVPRLDFELTPGCDHACGHCYNVWTAKDGDAQGGYPKGQLHGQAYLDMMRHTIETTGADHVTITGGEPLLRPDAMDIIDLACAMVSTVQLITNGSHVTPEVAQRLATAGVRSVQLTLLSADRERHNELKGAECFDDTLRAIVELTDHRVPVQVCFVAMAANWQDFEAVMELCYALGVRHITYNRMAPAGGAIHNIARLLPEATHIEHNLATAQRLGPKYSMGVATAMPIPPCLIRIERYPHVRFGFCSTGSHSPNIAIDANGNVRSCNLSAHLMGNILTDDWAKIHSDRYLHDFKKQVPDMCKGCAWEAGCQGGCKESGFAMFGDLSTPEPLLAMAKDPAWRDRLVAQTRPDSGPGDGGSGSGDGSVVTHVASADLSIGRAGR